MDSEGDVKHDDAWDVVPNAKRLFVDVACMMHGLNADDGDYLSDAERELVKLWLDTQSEEELTKMRQSLVLEPEDAPSRRPLQ